MRRVVITGLAPVCVNGIGKDEFWKNLLDKKIFLKEVPPEYEKNYRFKSRFFVPKPELQHKDLNKTMEEMSKIAVVAARLAVEDAGIKDLEHAGIILGVGASSLKTGFESYTAHVGGEGRYNRLVIPMLMPNSAAGWISILLGIKGPCYTVNASCASGASAIGEAFLSIKNGRLDVALTGGAECLDDGYGAVMRGFDALTALTTSSDGLPMPFSQKRSGFLFNMGAGCILVLEELERAKQRGANIYAEIVDYAANSDAYSIVQMPGDGSSVIKLFNMVKGVKIDYFNAHGTGTIQNDEIEAKIIKEVWGNNQPLINSTKGIIGHSIGASSAIEAVVAALSIKTGIVHGNVTLDVIDNLNLPQDSVEADIKYALSASYGFGGHNTLLMFCRYEDG